VPGLDDLPPPEGEAPTGWYPDPLGGKYPRWWNGSEWTYRSGEEPELPLEPGEDPDVPKRPRSPGALIGATFRLYGRFPLLFAVLAAGVIVPYDLIVLAITGEGPYTVSEASVGVQITLTVIPWILIGPLVSALHVHAVSDVRGGLEPSIADVALRGLRVLPVVAAATIMSSLGIAVGLLALIVPGVILFFRWAVVAQAAAIDHEGWLEALQRSRQLTAGNYVHIFLVVLLIGVTVGWTGSVAAIALRHDHSAAAFLVGLVINTVTAGFSALALAQLYFDLESRRERGGQT
jgi:Protein of unknown function (DUF2510)